MQVRLIKRALICQKILTREEKNNDLIDSAENLSGKQLDNYQDRHTASLNKTRLDGKFVRNFVISLSRRNLSRSEIFRLSKGLKFAPSDNMLDRAKLK